MTLVLVLEGGGGIVIDGRLFRGGHGLAGEVGHVQVPGAGGQELESLLGLGWILARHREASGDAEATLQGVLDEVRDRAPAAVTIADAWARRLALALVGICRVIDPSRVVLGGSVAALFPLVAARVATYVRASQAPTFPLPEIAVHEAPEVGAAYGAACMLHQRFLSLENGLWAEAGAGRARGARPAGGRTARGRRRAEMSDRPALAPDALGPTICVGEILVEIMATTVGCGFTEPVPLVGPFPSGAPAIFVSQCARMGGSAAMIGAVGDDDFGRLNVERLRRDGADVSGIRVDPDHPTGSAFVRYRADGSRDFVYNIARSAAARFGWTDDVRRLVERSGHLHVMGTALSMPSAWDVIERAVGIVKGRGGSLSLDPNLRKELRHDDETEARFARLVGLSDLLLPSGEELARAAGVEGEAAALARLFELGVGEVAMKRGARGATVVRADGARVEAPAFVVEEVDPTGAGDCFGGAYVAARRLGLAPAEALAYASAAGARNVTVRGPMEGAGTRAELDAFIAATERRA